MCVCGGRGGGGGGGGGEEGVHGCKMWAKDASKMEGDTNIAWRSLLVV